MKLNLTFQECGHLDITESEYEQIDALLSHSIKEHDGRFQDTVKDIVAADLTDNMLVATLQIHALVLLDLNNAHCLLPGRAQMLLN